MVAVPQRASTEEQKAQRREAIVGAAEQHIRGCWIRGIFNGASEPARWAQPRAFRAMRRLPRLTMRLPMPILDSCH
jgi:hypothetical protein